MLQGVGTSIAALVLPRWFVCGDDVVEVIFGLQKVESGPVSLDACADEFRTLVGDVPCNTGKISLGLGAAAAALCGVAMLLGAFIAATRRLGGMWGAALAANLLGGACAIASGAVYVATMVKETDGSSDCKPAQAAPILMVAGEFPADDADAATVAAAAAGETGGAQQGPGGPLRERGWLLLLDCSSSSIQAHSLVFVWPTVSALCARSGGVLAVISSCLYCTCCCRPASSTSRVEQVPMQQWQATPQY